MHATKRMLYQRCARRLVNSYPHRWRERYGTEMLLILEDSPPSAKTVLNLLLHLCDAYLHQTLVQEGIPNMLQRMRSNELIIYSATLIFFIAWFVAQLRIVVFGQPQTLFSGFTYTSSPIVNTMHSISCALPLLLLFGGFPILLAACWQAARERNFRLLLRCLLSLLSPLLIVILPLILTIVHLDNGWSLLFAAFVGLGLSLWLIIFSTQRVAPSRRITHYALTIATLVPIAMLVGLVALLLGFLSFIVPSISENSLVYILREALLTLIMLAAFLFTLISLKR